MTPNEYEILIDQIIKAGVDVDELRTLVTAEKNKREEAKRKADAAKKKQAALDTARQDLIDSIIIFLEELIDDKETWEWLESTEGILEITRSIKEIEKMTVPLFEKMNKETKVKKNDDFDALRAWLKSVEPKKKINDIQF